MDKTLRGAAEMTAAMTILGTIGLFVVLSGQAAIDVVFWRCAFGALALLVPAGLIEGFISPSASLDPAVKISFAAVVAALLFAYLGLAGRDPSGEPSSRVTGAPAP